MWPREVDWKTLRFGVELEFVGIDPSAVELLDGWGGDADERQLSLSGEWSGGEIRPSPMVWGQRAEIIETLARIRSAGGEVNWSCGLHVHVGLEAWGAEVLSPLLAAALRTQTALRELFQTPDHRGLYCPLISEAQRDLWLADPGEDALHHSGRPQGSRSGINVAAWYEFGTVELRFPNASLDPNEVLRTVECCLRWVAAVGAGTMLSADPITLAKTLGVPASGYPRPLPQPLWHLRAELLTEIMAPALQGLIDAVVPNTAILFVRPTAEGLFAKAEVEDRITHGFWFRPTPQGFTLVRHRPPGSDT